MPNAYSNHERFTKNVFFFSLFLPSYMTLVAYLRCSSLRLSRNLFLSTPPKCGSILRCAFQSLLKDFAIYIQAEIF